MITLLIMYIVTAVLWGIFTVRINKYLYPEKYSTITNCVITFFINSAIMPLSMLMAVIRYRDLFE